MKVPWELLLILVLLAIVAVATQQMSPERATPAPPDLASDSAAPGGSRALYLWLQSLGYRVERLQHRAFRPGEPTKALLILAPATRPSKDELSALRRWVEGGGNLIVTGEASPQTPGLPIGGSGTTGNSLPAILAEFGLAMRPLWPAKAEAAPSQPLLLRPMVGKVRVEATGYVSSTVDLVSYLGEPERPIAAGLAVGKGRVYALASAYAFSNQGIGQADNAALLLNWLPAPHEAGIVAFDEIHHGHSEARSLPYVLVHEPWGWAVLYTLGIAFLYLLLGGRRFGRPVPSIVDTRRLAAEYVVSLASLLRRGGKGEWVARHYERTLRQQLAAAGGLDPALDTSGVAARLKEMDRLAGVIEGRDASRALLELREGADNGISEGNLVRLAAEADRIIKAFSGRQR